ncbi:TPA: hypothetical protein QCJ52_004616 [Enterobacter ludwigii]|uniref:hypothetical protein n=1 Tax=Enterobacter ludwigii TaxID=299767 RepID=UPI002FD77332|nr:hypothetical protein [Enterobacter kobei]HDR2686615.1 hypothetical protein [Enterobacter ludwigii]
MTKTPPELVKMIISIDINTSRNAHRTGEYGYNNDCLLELQKAFPNGEVYESNVTYDEEGFEYTIPNTNYSIGVNRRWMGIILNGKPICLVSPKTTNYNHLDLCELNPIERTFEEILIKHF